MKFNKILFYLSIIIKKIEKKFNFTLYYIFPFRLLCRTIELFLFKKLDKDFEPVSNYFLHKNFKEKKNIFIISAGVGKNIDFEKVLLENFSISKMVMVDPTFYSQNMMNNLNLQKTYFFRRALDRDIGNKKIYKPLIKGDLNYSLENSNFDENNFEYVKTTNIKALLKFMGFDNKNTLILKLDVEGVADKIILDCLSNNVFPDSINFELEKPNNIFSQFNYFRRVFKLNNVLKKNYKLYRNTETKLGFRIELTANKLN